MSSRRVKSAQLELPLRYRQMQAVGRAHVALDGGIDVGVGADRAGQLADADGVAGPDQALPVTPHLQRPQRQLGAHRGRLGVDAVGPADAQRVAKLIKALDSEDFAVRSQAERELEQLGEAAADVLRKTNASSLEARRRIEQLLRALEPPITHPQHLRALRAVEALEYMNSPDAVRLLERLADGEPRAQRTQEACASLQRLARRRAE